MIHKRNYGVTITYYFQGICQVERPTRRYTSSTPTLNLKNPLRKSRPGTKNAYPSWWNHTGGTIQEGYAILNGAVCVPGGASALLA